MSPEEKYKKAADDTGRIAREVDSLVIKHIIKIWENNDKEKAIIMILALCESVCSTILANVFLIFEDESIRESIVQRIKQDAINLLIKHAKEQDEKTI